MEKNNQELEFNSGNTLSILGGVLVGSLVGAVTMLLLAPRSGKETRKMISDKGNELRDRTTEMVDESVAQVRSSASNMAVEGRGKFQELKHHGQEIVVEQLNRITEAAQAGKKAMKNS